MDLMIVGLAKKLQWAQHQHKLTYTQHNTYAGLLSLSLYYAGVGTLCSTRIRCRDLVARRGRRGYSECYAFEENAVTLTRNVYTTDTRTGWAQTDRNAPLRANRL